VNEQTVTTLALLVLVVVLVVAAAAILGPQLGQLIHMPAGVLR
jgi:hypothetical protein